jgi:hypothetical protein
MLMHLTALSNKYVHLYYEVMERTNVYREHKLQAPSLRSSLLYHQIPSLFYECTWGLYLFILSNFLETTSIVVQF